MSHRRVWRLARHTSEENESSPSIGQWLSAIGQSPSAQERFWSVVLVSALGESLDRASITAARKVFVDGFMANRTAYQVDVPTISLGRLYDGHVADHLERHQVALHRETAVRQVHVSSKELTLELADGTQRCYDFLVLATSWRRAESLLADELRAQLPQLQGWSDSPSSPITGVHLWFDRPLTSLTHAILVGHLSQWVFNHGCKTSEAGNSEGHYYQVVISSPRPDINEAQGPGGQGGQRIEHLVARGRTGVSGKIPSRHATRCRILVPPRTRLSTAQPDNQRASTILSW